MFLLTLDSGARPGEVFALEWKDFDENRGTIRITRSLEEIDGKLRIKRTKTKRSNRQVALESTTVDCLLLHRGAAKEAGRDVVDGPIFADSKGRRLRLDKVHRDVFKPLLERLVRVATRSTETYSSRYWSGLCALRHTCATLLLLANVNPKVVSERLGHSSITLTLDTDSHVLSTMQKAAADTIDKLLG